jgi:hypothetical protein
MTVSRSDADTSTGMATKPTPTLIKLRVSAGSCRHWRAAQGARARIRRCRRAGRSAAQRVIQAPATTRSTEAAPRATHRSRRQGSPRTRPRTRAAAEAAAQRRCAAHPRHCSRCGLRGTRRCCAPSARLPPRHCCCCALSARHARQPHRPSGRRARGTRRRRATQRACNRRGAASRPPSRPGLLCVSTQRCSRVQPARLGARQARQCV